MSSHRLAVVGGAVVAAADGEAAPAVRDDVSKIAYPDIFCLRHRRAPPRPGGARSLLVTLNVAIASVGILRERAAPARSPP